MIIRVNHARQAGYCSRGMRAFFVKYDLNWSEFLKNGLPEETLLATGDALARKVVEIAHER